MRTMEILSAVTGGGGEAGPAVEAVKLAPFVKTVAAEQQLLNTLQIILAKQVRQPTFLISLLSLKWRSINNLNLFAK